jgi:amidase
LTDIAYEPAYKLAGKLRSREIGCLELLDHHLARVERFNPALNAIIWMDRDAARERARQADQVLARGEIWGPLHGLPMTVKESFDLTGAPTTWGIPEMRDHIATAPAVATDRLTTAGAIIFGKTNVPLMLADWQSFNAIYGTTNNPWDLTRTPGGSSGGSTAALAAGLSALELGSDIGASIRNPAHYCGVLGHKPSWGIVPLRGHSAAGGLAMTDISVAGPLARTAEDLALALSVVAGPDELDVAGWRLLLPKPAKTKLADYRIAVMLSDPNSAVDNEYSERLAEIGRQLAKLGAKVSFEARPAIDTVKAHALYIRLLRAVTMSRIPPAVFAEWQARAAALAPEDDSYKARVARAATILHRDWLAAHEERTKLRWAWHAFFQDWDVLLTPAAAGPAWPHDQTGDRLDRVIPVNGKMENTNDQLFWAGISGVVFLPSTVTPIGLTQAGLPLGVQIIADHLQDLTSIEFARLLAREIGGFVPPPGY